jgi:hypothetical protein
MEVLLTVVEVMLEVGVGLRNEHGVWHAGELP